MTFWSQVFLGVIALATLTTAIVQVGLLIAASRVARRVEQLAHQFETDLRPTLVHVNAIGRDASRAVALATAQVERADRLFGEISRRVEETVAEVQNTVVGPAREGKAIFSAIKAALSVLHDARRRARQRAEDEDALFI